MSETKEQTLVAGANLSPLPDVQKVLVIANPAAGQDKPVLGTLNKAFKDAAIDWDLRLTKGAGDAYRLTGEALAAGVDVVAVYGGDGTVMEVAQGLRGSDVPLAIFPSGTANIMAFELGIPGDLAAAAALVCTRGAVLRKVDMGQTDNHFFILRLGIGMAAETIRGAEREAKNRYGLLAYIISGLKALKNPLATRYRLTLDGKQEEIEGVSCFVANSGSLGVPGMHLAPNMDVSDGLLDVVVVRSADLGSLVSAAASAIGIAQPLPRWQAREITVVTDTPQPVECDGEIIEPTPLTARVLPEAVRIIVPPPPASTEGAAQAIASE